MRVFPTLLNLTHARADWDVVVVGAGLAGSLAARGLAGRGLTVLLVDRAAFPRWKVCGSCLNPYTLSVLAQAGLRDLPDRCGAVPLGLIHLAVRGRQADIALPAWKVLSREQLDMSLAEAAIEAGAAFLPGTQAALGPIVSDGRTVILHQEHHERSVRARLVLAADGLGSRLLAGQKGVQPRTAPDARVGAGVVIEAAPEYYRSGAVYMAYGKGGYVGLVRLEDGRLNVGAALDLGTLRPAHGPGQVAADLIREVGWPEIPGLMDQPWRGTPALTRQVARPAAERVLAVGDAAGYVEPFTGEGMGWALASGLAVVPLAARAVTEWLPELADRWAARHKACAARRQRLCWAMTWLSRHPMLARQVVGLLSRLPWLAAPLVGHVRAAAT